LILRVAMFLSLRNDLRTCLHSSCRMNFSMTSFSSLK
jgi:hypothetical protein